MALALLASPVEWESGRLAVLAELEPASGTRVPGFTQAHSAPRDRLGMFVQRSPVPVVSFVGKKRSGKTSVVGRVVSCLCERGYRVAGAIVAGLCSQREYSLVARSPRRLDLEGGGPCAEDSRRGGRGHH